MDPLRMKFFPYLAVAYGLAWLILFGYLWRIHRSQLRLERRLRAVEAARGEERPDESP